MMFNKPYQVIFGTVRAIIELIFPYGKKLMKSSGDCETDGAKSQSSQQCPAMLPSAATCCGQTGRPGDWGGERTERPNWPLKERYLQKEKKKTLCNKKIKKQCYCYSTQEIGLTISPVSEGAAKNSMLIMASGCWHLVLEWESWYFYFSLSYYETLWMKV